MRRLLVVAMLVAAAGSPVAGQIHGGELIRVPLRVHGGRLLVPVQTPGGATLEFILSTGNAVAVFSESGAARIGEDREGLSLGGKVPLVTDGSATVSDEALTVEGAVVDGIIGSNTLNQFDILVDVPGDRLILKPVGRTVEWAGMALSDPVRLRVFHGVVLGLDVELEGTEYGAMLDLGTPTLVANEGLKSDLGIDSEDVVSLGLGSTTHPNLPVRVLDLELFQRWVPGGDGFLIVGAPVAYDCAISISWVHQEMRTCVQ